MKTTINAIRFIEIILDVLVRYHDTLDLIVINRGSFLASSFWLSIWYFLDIKQKLSTTFYPNIDIQIYRQNNIIKAYLSVFI